MKGRQAGTPVATYHDKSNAGFDMIWLYRLLFLPLLLIALPRYIWRMRRRGGYRGSTAQRLGWRLDPPPRTAGRLRVWVQAVSVGELGAIEPLLRELARDERFEFVLTTTTSTGRALAHRRMGDLCAWIGWFPLDFVWCNRRFWQRLQPDAAFLMESELWPEHLHQARSRRVPVFLINARLSDRSFARHQRFGGIARRLGLDQLAMILAAAPQDAERWRALIPAGRVALTGNLKLDLPVVDRDLQKKNRAHLAAEFGFVSSPSDESPLILLGNSTWPGEEALLLEVWRSAVQAGVFCRLVLVPRHAERREEIRSLLTAEAVSHHFRSESLRAPVETQVYVGDTTGELVRLLQAADVVFVGKSLSPHEGGQNPIEAVSLRLPVVFGPRMSNFREIADGMMREGVARAGRDANECAALLSGLLHDAGARTRCAAAADRWLAAHRGALRRTADILRVELAPWLR